MNTGSGLNMGFVSERSRPTELALRFTPELISLNALEQASGRDPSLPKPLHRARPSIHSVVFRAILSKKIRRPLWPA